MAEGNDFELAHDVEGIFWHLDREAGRLRTDRTFFCRHEAEREAN